MGPKMSKIGPMDQNGKKRPRDQKKVYSTQFETQRVNLYLEFQILVFQGHCGLKLGQNWT